MARCDHGNEMSALALSELPKSTLGRGRHKCPICAYTAGTPKLRLRAPGPVDVEKTCAAISTQVKLLRRSRATFPYISPTVVGQTNFKTAPYYLVHGHHITFTFDTPITEATRKEVNEVGYWINQNFMMRLYAVLEAGRIVGNRIRIEDDLDGCKEIKLLRWLRNKFSHGSGAYKATVAEDRKLREALIELFNVSDREPPDSSGWFPIPIKGVLMKLADGCERYVRALGSKTSVSVSQETSHHHY
jgi:hypothetical protein